MRDLHTSPSNQNRTISFLSISSTMPATLTSVYKQTQWILKTPILKDIVPAVAKVYNDYAGFRQLGLRVDDLYAEETPVMQKALSRLPASEIYSRNFRLLTAHQLALSHHLLPLEKQVTYENDTPYLTPYILEAELEAAEKSELDNIVVSK